MFTPEGRSINPSILDESLNIVGVPVNLDKNGNIIVPKRNESNENVY
jgi:hypothetical protein